MDVDPRFTPDGRYLLLASDRTGIYDVYALRARDRAAVSGDQRAVRRVPAGRLARRQPAGLHRLQHRTASISTRCRSIPRPSGWRSRSRTRAPTSPADIWTATPIHPIRSVGPVGPPTIMRTTSYKPWKYMYPRSWELQLTTPRRSGSAPPASSARRSPIRSATTWSALTCWSRWTATVGRGRLLVPRLFPSFDSPSGAPAQRVPGLIIDGVDTLYRQHVLNGSAAIAHDRTCRRRRRRADLSFGYDYTAYGPADPLPIADPTGGIVSPAGARTRRRPVPVVVLLQRPQLALLDQRPGGARSSGSISAISDPALGGASRRTEVSWSRGRST